MKLLDENTIELNNLCKKHQQYTEPTSDTLVQNEDGKSFNEIDSKNVLY